MGDLVEIVERNLNNPVHELKQIFADQKWQSGYVEQNTSQNRKKLDILNRKIKSEAGGIVIRKFNDPKSEGFRQALPKEIERQRGEHQEEIFKANKDLKDKETVHYSHIEKIAEELESRVNDPKLLAAFEYWGRSPNHDLKRGDDGNGFNAGVIHYFEYRAFEDKQGHNEDMMSLDGFIEWSNHLTEVVNHPDSNVKQIVDLEDENGKKGRYILDMSNNMIISYSQNNKPFKIVTAIPGQNEGVVKERVESEIKSPVTQKSKRLNHLGEKVRVLD